MQESVHNFFGQVKEYGVYYFGPDQPQRMWYAVMAACFLGCFYRGTRRMAGFGLVGVLVVYAAWSFLSDTFAQTAPPPPGTKSRMGTYR